MNDKIGRDTHDRRKGGRQRITARLDENTADSLNAIAASLTYTDRRGRVHTVSVSDLVREGCEAIVAAHDVGRLTHLLHESVLIGCMAEVLRQVGAPYRYNT